MIRRWDLEIEPPIVIHMVPHVRQQNIRLPYTMKEAARNIVKEKPANSLLEFSQGPYHDHRFLLKKKRGEYMYIINYV